MFDPWIGATYQAAPFPRSLILGESHYGEHHIQWGYDLRMKTIRSVKDQIQPNKPYPYYTKLLTAILGHKPALAEKRTFFHSVAVHNLITTPLIGIRCPPSPEQWAASLLTLPDVLASLRPDYVLVLGYRMWQRVSSMSCMKQPSGFTNVGPCGVRTNAHVLFHGIMHPSGPFSPSRWHGFIQQTKSELATNRQ